MSQLHVCQIGPIPPPWGGVETNMMGLCDYIRAKGARCSVVNLTRHRQPNHDDLYFPTSAKELVQTILTLKPDVVHIHLGGRLFMRLAALLGVIGLLPGTRSVFTFHSGGFPTSPEGLAARYMSLRGLAVRQLDAVIAVNQALVDTFANYGVNQRKLFLIEPSGAAVDLDAINREQLPPDLEQFAGAHMPLLVTVAQLEPEYGIDVQLAAFGDIRREYPNAGLMILGGGSLHETIRQQIAVHPEREGIMLCGSVPRPKTLALMKRASLLLRTTHYDGDALSIREALAMGTRVLATDNGMRPEGVFLLKNLIADELCKAIRPALAQAAPANGADARNPMDSVFALYQKLIAPA